MTLLATKRQWRVARRLVSDAYMHVGEGYVAKGAGAFLDSDEHRLMWVEAYLGVTQHRLVWALPKGPRDVFVMLFDDLVRYCDERGFVGLRVRDPRFTEMAKNPDNPHGETDALFRFDDPALSTEARDAIVQAVRLQGAASQLRLADYDLPPEVFD